MAVGARKGGPAAASALEEYFRHLLPRAPRGVVRDATPRKRMRWRSVASGGGAQLELLRARIAPLLRRDGITRKWATRGLPGSGARKTRVIERRRTMLTRRRRALSLFRDEAKVRGRRAVFGHIGLWGASYEESWSPPGKQRAMDAKEQRDGSR